MPKKAIIVGAGLAGIASAIRLARKGISTEVFEANTFPGGKINSRTFEGYRFDQGPSILTAPEYIKELYDLCGKDFSDFPMIESLDFAFKYFYRDGTVIELKHDQEQVISELTEKLGEDRDTVTNYLTKAKKNYELIAPLFIEKSLHRVRGLLGLKLLKALSHLPSYKLFSTMAQENKRYFKNPRTAQIFNRFAQYNGSHPFLAPAMLNMISHLEINIGPCLPKNGIVQIANSLYQLAVEQGVKFHFNEKVEEIIVQNGQVGGVRTASGTFPADFVISNMDVAYTYEQLMPRADQPKKILAQEKSSSVIVFQFGIKKQFPQLCVHNMVFSDEDKKEFDAVFIDKTMYKEPSFYIYISSKVIPEDAPQGCENWFILLNAPINCGQNWDQLIADKRCFVIKQMSDLLGEEIEPLIATENVLDPRLIESRYFGKQGSIYGNASNSRFSAFYRHPNYSKKIKGLYFAGVSVHPGGGIPLALNSAKIACSCLFDDFKMN